MASIFDSENNEFATDVENEALEKALTAGYGTDAASYEGGRALQREDLESTLVNVLDVLQKDCKVFNKMHKQPVGSTVHQVIRRTGVGDDEFNFVGEGDLSREDDQSLERKVFETKYISTKCKVSHQLTLTNNADNPINSEKVAGVTRITRSVERAIFHGDSSVQPKAFDGFLKTLRDSAMDTSKKSNLRATRKDLRGLEIGETSTALGLDAGEALFDEIAQEVYSKGGDLDRAYFSPILAGQFKRIYTDRLRYLTGDTHTSLTALPDVTTAIGSTIKIKDDAGADKMFKVKGEVFAAGDPTLRPYSPTVAASANASDSDSQFTDGFAGDYKYSVHAINAYGISAAAEVTSAVTVAAGGSVTLTITPSSNGPTATGYIITRTNAGGEKLMEMVRIPAKVDEAVTYKDENADLPGTASVVLLTENTQELKPTASFGQLMPISSFDLPTDSSLAHKFVIAIYGMLEVRAPEFCAIIDNVGYAGGLY